MTARPLRIGITLGDLNGIGPEIAFQAACRRSWPAGVRFVLIGGGKAVEQQAEALGLRMPVAWEPGAKDPRSRVWLWQPAAVDRRLTWRPGRVSAAAARAAGQWIRAAADACMAGHLDAMVTAPIHKEGFHRAGIDFPGHTELLAQQTGTAEFGMMLIGDPLRVMLATRHVPIARVPEVLTRGAVRQAIRLTADALPWLGCPAGKIAVCGLNPHAGDGGVIGREEIDTIAPVIRAERRRGTPVEGPVPADTVFHQAIRGEWQAIVAMYHDQGLAPLKMHAFDRGVNLTLGLPIVRTSPDHGTAYPLAGTGRADASSMCAAIRTAIQLARRPNPWRRSPARP